MFCHECGNKLESGERFCSSCGAAIEAVSVPKTAPVQQTAPAQQAAPVQLNQQLYQNNQPVQQAYPYQQPAAQYAPPAVKKKGSKAPLIIAGAGVAAVIVAGVGVGGFFIYQDLASTQYIKNNPTKAVANSYTSYLSERNDSGTKGLVSILKNTEKQGTVRVSLKTEPLSQSGKPYEASMVYAFNKKTNEYYVRTDNALGLLISSGADDQSGKTFFEAYSDVDTLNLRYNIERSDGSYRVDIKNFRNAAEASIFSPKNENVLKVSEEDFEDFVKFVEKYYKKLSDSPDKTKEEAIDKLVKIIEDNCKPEVAEEKISVRGSERDVITITYNLDKTSLQAVVKGLHEQILKDLDVEANDNGEDDIGMKQSVDEFFKSIEESLKDARQDLSVSIVSSIDKRSKQAARLSVSVSNYSENQKDGDINAVLEFGNDAEINVYGELSIEGENGGKATLSLKSEVEGHKTAYSAEVTSKGNNEKKTNVSSAELLYDDENKKYELSYTTDGEKTVVAQGDADISEHTARFTYTQSLEEEYKGITAYKRPDENAAKSVSFTIEISDEPQIVKFEGNTDVFAMSKADFERLSESLGRSGRAYPTEPDDHNYYDGDDYSFIADKTSAIITHMIYR